MNLYVNVSGGTLTLPVPGGLVAKVVGPGESFVGSTLYDRYVSTGQLAKIKNTQCHIRYFVTEDDLDHVNATVEDTVAPYRYKANDGVGLSSLRQIKAILSFDRDIEVGQNMMVTYYFYTAFETCGTYSHSIQTYEQYTGRWTMPIWSALPADFYDLGPKDQLNALLARTG